MGTSDKLRRQADSYDEARRLRDAMEALGYNVDLHATGAWETDTGMTLDLGDSGVEITRLGRTWSSIWVGDTAVRARPAHHGTRGLGTIRVEGTRTTGQALLDPGPGTDPWQGTPRAGGRPVRLIIATRPRRPPQQGTIPSCLT